MKKQNIECNYLKVFYIKLSPYLKTMCIIQNKYTRSSILSKQIRGWGTTAFPVVIATGSRGHPIGSPSEHHRDPIVILLNPSTTWGTKRLKWESNKHPMGPQHLLYHQLLEACVQTISSEIRLMSQVNQLPLVNLPSQIPHRIV